ncbi:MAG: hypothetical protein C4K58_04675 [Flavobacteriaceae bacterium]|nr:MAG: hypothetical protein C4K58_04675 [Flavobacteriaceae bacterium]
MEKIILYIKTFKQDFNSFKILVESIRKYNSDKIPLLISVNDSDYDFFKTEYPNLNIIPDSEIYKSKVEIGWVYQQTIKSQLHKLNIAHNYVCLDSDSYFIRDFYITDFMFDDITPYTLIHEQKELFQWTDNNLKTLGSNPKEYFFNVCNKVMSEFKRKGVVYDFGPSPVIWSTKVWRSFEVEYLQKNNKTFDDIITDVPSEFTWYGEWLLFSKKIEIYPREPLFKVFHYQKQFKDYIKQGNKIENLESNYLGVVMQSNWKNKKKSKWYNFFKR